MVSTMKKNSTNATATIYPVQLISLGVKELSIKSNVQPDVDVEADASKCSIRIGSTDYDKKEKVIVVTLRLELGTSPNETDSPFTMKIELVGFFQVMDEIHFPIQHISDWANQNAPFVLYPYLREHVFGLSARCGFKPLILPLLEVPTFKIDKPKQPKPRRGVGK